MNSKRNLGRSKNSAIALLAICAGLVATAPATAQTSVIAPDKAAERDTSGLREIATDPFGNVYGVSEDSPYRLFKFGPDLSPIYDRAIGAAEPAVATDSAGRVLIAGSAGFERYSAAGGALGSYGRAGIGTVGGMASDASDHFYLPELDHSGAAILSEYQLVAGAPSATGSTPYLGTPNDNFVPLTFFDTAVDPERNVYVSGFAESPEAQFIQRYGPDLAGSPFTIKSCPVMPGCGWAVGLGVARLATTSGSNEFLVADNYLSNNVQIYSTGASGSPVGTFPLDIAPGSLAIPIDFASSDCTGSLYVLLAVFGNPGGTYSGSRLQRYETGAEAGPCPAPPLVTLTGLDKQTYKLLPRLGAPGPCIPCAVLKRNGTESLALATRRSGRESLAKRKGLKLRFETSVAGDVRFLVRGPTEARGKPKRRGGFLYAAGAGANQLTFTGVLHKGKALAAGTYKTKVTDAAGTKLEAFKIKVRRR